MKTVSFDQLLTFNNEPLGKSNWILVDQARINTFADCTEDNYFIHVDPERAAKTPLGGTIAHGLLTLSLVPKMLYQLNLDIKGIEMGFNYGYDNIRFIAPVKVDKRVRADITIANVKHKGGKKYLLTYAVSVEIEGEEKPALICNWLTMFVSE